MRGRDRADWDDDQGYYQVPVSEPTKNGGNDHGNLNHFIKDPKMIETLNRKGIKKLLPIQYETFEFIYHGIDVVAKDRTGSGKTIAFSLPTILRLREQKKFNGPRMTRFLIVLPTRELAIQVKDEIDSLAYQGKDDFNAVAVYGGAGISDQQRSLSKGADIIVGTPGRLIDFLKNGHINLEALESICLDEADEMLKIGFKEDIEMIFKHIYRATTNKVQCMLFSATIPEWIWDISKKYQSANKKFVDMLKDGYTKTSKTVDHYCIEARSNEKEYLIGPLVDYFFKGKGKECKVIIFCETKREVERVGYSGSIPLNVEMLHGDFKQPLREKVFRKFKSGQAACLIATNVAARGLDFPEIDLIIQMQPPTTTDSYIHRSGRTGRAGRAGICLTLYTYGTDDYLMERIQKEAKISFKHVNSGDLKPIQRPPSQSYGQWRNSLNTPDNGYNQSMNNSSYDNRNSYGGNNYRNNYDNRRENYQENSGNGYRQNNRYEDRNQGYGYSQNYNYNYGYDY